jgi:HSP20 family protein
VPSVAGITTANLEVDMNTLMKWSPFGVRKVDPFRSLASEVEEMEKRFATMFNRSLSIAEGREAMKLGEWEPAVDITEDDKEFLVKAELPEMKKEDVKVSVENGALEITGERKMEKEEKGKKYHRIERAYGTFVRSFTLPEGTTPEKISAEFKDGVLKVHLPKDGKTPQKEVDIKVQ